MDHHRRVQVTTVNHNSARNPAISSMICRTAVTTTTHLPCRIQISTFLVGLYDMARRATYFRSMLPSP